MSQPIRGHLVFPIRPNNTNFVEDLEFLLPVKFRQIPISGVREEVSGATILVFFYRSKNTNLVEDVEFLIPVKFRQIPISCVRENVLANQRPGGHVF